MNWTTIEAALATVIQEKQGQHSGYQIIWFWERISQGEEASLHSLLLEFMDGQQYYNWLPTPTHKRT